MRILITGICGFVGSTLAREFRRHYEDAEIFGFDSFIRPGSELNRQSLREAGVNVVHADMRSASDMDALPGADWIIDAAASPSVLAGVDGRVSSRQVVEHNLGGTINILEYCRQRKAGFILLSTSRVYSITPLSSLDVQEVEQAYRPTPDQQFPPGVSLDGVSEGYSTSSPISLYGSTKLASEGLALEYGETFGFPVWIDRCGVLAGAGQFGRADQGIFSFWINAWIRNHPLRYIGFQGRGYQVRDCLHPRDLVPLLYRQMNTQGADERIFNLGGGIKNSMSLAQLSNWCENRFGARPVTADLQPRRFDIPWLVLACRRASQCWNWTAETSLESILNEIADHGNEHPDWLELSNG
jgi:CDP-paratose 2-epimerase